MSFFEKLLEAIKPFQEILHEIISWFKKTREEKISNEVVKIDKEIDKAKKEGRPTWKS